MQVPVVEYDFSKLPPPVARLREQIIEAATTGDPEKLRPIIDANGEPPQFGLERQRRPDRLSQSCNRATTEGARFWRS